MPGPMSLPQGNTSKLTYDDLINTICDIHFECDDNDKFKHDFITYREWLSRRGRLTTGKTV